MAQTKFKFKTGELVLVQHRYKSLQSMYGIDIIVGPKQLLTYNLAEWGPAYDVYWTKTGLDWHYERYLERVT